MMDPIYVILYAVIITLLLTLALPRLSQVSPALKRFFWLTAVVGGIVLLVFIYLAFIA
jgi:hypothetical protein